MKTQIRIIAGSLRGRKVSCTVTPELRPTPQMVREAFFSILGNAIPGRAFIDMFAGTGVVGMEALSRGASETLFIERDPALAGSIEARLREFGVARQGKIYRTDAYRWAAAWRALKDPVNIFVSPPFVDLGGKTDDLMNAVHAMQAKVAEDSLIVIQSEHGSALDEVEELQTWERRQYGRNELLLWQREITPAQATDVPPGIEHDRT